MFAAHVALRTPMAEGSWCCAVSGATRGCRRGQRPCHK